MAELHAGPPTRLVVGVGVNLFSTPTPNGACLADHGEITSVDEFLWNVITKLESLNDSSEATLERYRQRSVTLSTDVRVEQPHRWFHGTAIDIDGEYRLVVDRHGQTEVVDVGDVIHLRPASGVS